MENTEYQGIPEEEALNMLRGSGKTDTQKYIDFIQKTKRDEAEAERVRERQEAAIERQKQIEKAKENILETPEHLKNIGGDEKTIPPPKFR